ncbi:MAG: FtsQ-type POTRA domain-containing protein [Myxococcales bacterium]|nr:FtsQ-type POTRA domain-containing protein [Myxococcales bacterium]
MRSNRFKGGRREGEARRPGLLGLGLRFVIRQVAPVLKLGLVAAFLALAAWTAYTAVLRSPYFRVRVVEANETAHLDRRAIIERVGLGQPTNLFRFDTKAAEEALLAHPWVARAAVRTVLPDRVEVDLEERAAAGVVALESLFLVDDTGRPIVPAQPTDVAELPLVTGLDRRDYEVDAEATRARIRDALALARQYRNSPMAAVRPLSDVHLAPIGRMELMLGRTRVVLGRDRYRQKLELLNQIFTQLAERDVDAAYILLSEDLERAVVKEQAVDQGIGGSLSLRPEGGGNHGVQ